MQKFIFDLQRFADICKIGDKTYSSISAAIAAITDDTETTITVTANAENQSFSVTSGKNVIIDFGGSYKLTLGANAITIDANSKLTLQNMGGNFGSSGSERSVTVNGELTLSNLSNITSNIKFAAASNGKIILGTNLPTIANAFPKINGTYSFNNYFNFKLNAATKLTTGSTSIEIPFTSAVSVSTDGENYIAYQNTKTSSSLYITNDTSNENKPCLTGLADGCTFTAKSSDDKTIYYTVSGSTINAGTSSDTMSKTWSKPVTSLSNLSLEYLDYDTYFKPAYTVKDDKLEIATNTLTDGEEYILVSNIGGKVYGTITKNGNTYSVKKTDGADGKLNAVTISDGSKVTFTKDFTNIPITTGTDKTATFKVASDDDADYTVDSANNSVAGANNITLTGGTFLTTTEAQTIVSGNYTVSGYNSTGTADGINIIYGSGTTSTIGDIDNDESFTVGTVTYDKSNIGLKNNSSQIYVGDGDSDEPMSVDLATLASRMKNLAAPTDKTIVLGSGVGGITASSLIVNSTSDPTVKYADLTVDGGDYTLSTVNSDAAGSGFQSAVTTIRLQNVKATVAKELGLDKTIITSGGTTFTVTDTGDNATFTVDTSATAPKITNAVAITLTAGSLTATKDQTVTFAGKELKVTTGDVVIALNGTSYTVTATNGDVFTLGGRSYTVTKGTVELSFDGTNTTINLTTSNGVKIDDTAYAVTSGDGISLVDDGSDITVTGIKNDNEAFTINNGTEYTFTNAKIGLVRSDTNIWTGETITETSKIDVDNLVAAAENNADWSTMVIGNTDLTIDSSSTSCVLVDSKTSPTKTYGKLTVETDNSITLEKYLTGETLKDETLKSITVTGTTANIGTDYAEVPAVKLTNENSAVNYAKDTSDAYTVKGTVDKFVLGTKIFTPKTNDTFTIDDDTTYLMTGAGLTKDDHGYIWSKPNATDKTAVKEYDLSNGGTFSKMYVADSNALTITDSNSPEANNIIVDSTYATRLAQLTYANNSYTFAKISSDITKINLPADDLTVETDFTTQIITAGAGTVTANGNKYGGTATLTIDLTATSSKKSSTLNTGTVTLAEGDTVTTTDGTVLTTTGDGITAEASSRSWTNFSGLNDGDVLTVNGTSYQVSGTKTLIQRDSSDGKLYMPNISNGQIEYSALTNASNFRKIFPLTSGGVLDLSTVIDEAAIVINYGDPTVRVGDLSYTSSGGYSFKKRSSDGNTEALTGIQISNSTPVLSTDIKDAVITTSGNTVYKVNGKSFEAQGTLTILTPTVSTAYLTDGTITMTAGDSATNNVITRRVDTDGIKHDEKISVTTGEMTVTASSSSRTVTIGALEAGNVFSVDGTSYTMTNVGPALTDKTKLYPTSATSATTANLGGDDFKPVLAATGGAIAITASTDADVVLADLSDAEDSAYYGTLTKQGKLYTLDASGSALKNITVTDTKITLPVLDKNTNITVGTTTFTVEATKAFTVDATNGLALSDVTAINLSSGTINAPIGIPVNADDNYTVTANANTAVTVTVNGKNVTVGGIDLNESFTVDDTTYTLTVAGLYDAANNQIVTEGYSDGTFNLNDAETAAIIAPTGTTLDLTSPKSAVVYDNLTNPRIKLATLTVGSKIELKGEDVAPSKIKTVNVPANRIITADFATKISAPTGSVTLNDVNFDATTAVVLATDGTNATLFSGTVALDLATPTVSADDGTIEIAEGEFTVTAAEGKFSNISGLDAGERFTYGGNTYTQTAIGLMTGSTLCTALVGTTIDVSKISSAKWYNLIGLTDGALDLSKATADSLVVDSIAKPSTKLGTLTVSGTDYGVDFAVKVNASAGTFSLNGQNYTGTTALVLDATTTSSTLNTGTVTVDGTVTATNDTISGAGFNATAKDGKFTQITELDAGDIFTYGGTTYTQYAPGLVTGSTICTALAGNTIDTAKLSTAKWENFVAPTDGVLNLVDATTAVVVDNAANPAQILGNLTVDGTTYTVNYATKVKAADTVTVNGVNFVGSGNILLDTTATSSTLNTGTIAVDGTATATNDTISGTGFTATAADGKFTAISGLDIGESFTYGGKTYMQTALGLMTGETLRRDLTASTLDLSKLDGTWTNYLPIDGNLEIPQEIDDSVLLVDENFTQTYGTLTKTDDGFSLTNIGDATLTAITVTGTKLELAADFASVPLTLGETQISNITLRRSNKSFTADATAPSLSENVTAFTLNDGEIVATNQTVTAGENIIVATNEIKISLDEIGAIDEGDTFTLNGKIYQFVNENVGLFNSTDSKLVTEGFDDNTLIIGEIEETATIAPTDGVLDLTGAVTSIVVDSVKNPTTRLGNLTVDGTTYTVNYATKVKTADTVTINGVNYVGSGTLTIDATATSSTLNTGTIAVDGTATATNDTISGTGFTATAADGKFTKISGLDTGESFTYGGKTYTQTALGLMTGETLRRDLTASTLDLSKLDGTWTNYLPIDGTLEIPQEIDDSVLLVDENLTQTYGTLTKTDDGFSLMNIGDATLTAITVTGTKLELAADFASVPLTLGETQISAITLRRSNKSFTADATAPSLSDNVTAFTLNDGEIIATNQTVTAGENIIVATNEIKISLDEIAKIDTGDTFTLNGKIYQFVNENVGLFNSTDSKLVTEGFDDDTLIIGDIEETATIAPKDGVLDLTGAVTSIVVDSVKNPTTRLGNLTVDGTTYTVNYATKVKTADTVTINGVNYVGSGTLTIDTTATSSTLNTGTIAVDGTATATNDTISGTGFTATAADGKFTKISGLDTGESFTYGGKTYTQTALGLMTGETLRRDLTASTLDLSKLDGTWTNYLPIDGTLEIPQEIDDSVLLVDENLTQTYGTLTKTDDGFSLTNIGDVTLTAITVTGTKIELAADFATVPLTLGDAQISNITLKSKSKPFTADATVPNLSDNVTAFTLNDGEIIAANQTVTAGENVIVATDEIQISLDEIGAINEGDTFTLNGKIYRLVNENVGLLNSTDSKLVTEGFDDDTLIIGDIEETAIIAPTNEILDLRAATENAIVVDSITNPTERLGTLTVDENEFTVDYETKVRTASGTVTVNGETYNATTELILDSDGTTSTLYTGTVTATGTTDNALYAGAATSEVNNRIIATDDEITVENGTITATAADGKFTTISGLDAGESFTYGDKTYTQTALGLMTGETIRRDLTASTLDLSKLDGTWTNYLQIDGTLEIPQEIDDSVLLVDEDFTQTYGTLTATDDGFSLTNIGDATLTAITVTGTKIELAADFATVPLTLGDAQISSITLKSTSKPFTADATVPNLSENVTAFTLNDGEIVATNQTVTAGENVIVATNEIKISLDEIGAIDGGDTFTLNGKIYRLVNENVGLLNSTDSKLVTEGFDDDTLIIGDIEETAIIAPTNEILDLTAATENAIVVDSVTNPTERLGTLTVDENEFTVDYETKVKTGSGTVTVNGETYNATTELILDSDGTTSTLYTGTVTLEAGDGVISSDKTEVGSEEGTITVTAKDGAITVSSFDVGDSFAINDTEYKICAAGIINGDGQLWTGKDFAAGLTPDELSDATNWTRMLDAEGGNIGVDGSTLGDGETAVLVDNIDNPTQIFGTLTKVDDKYTLDSAADTPISIMLEDSVIDIANALGSVPITTFNADGTETEFTVTPSSRKKYFTVTATGDRPFIENADAVHIISGPLGAEEGIDIIPASDDAIIKAGNGTHKINGETIVIAGLEDDYEVEIELKDGKPNTVTGIQDGATITLDGETYTAPEDNATLTFTEDDGWFFDNYTPEKYFVTVDNGGNVSVPTGIKFSDAISSGKTLVDGAIQLATDLAKTPVTITNNGTESVIVNDADGEELAEILNSTGNVEFTADAINAEGNAQIKLPGESTVNGVKVTGDDDYTVTVTEGTVTALTDIGDGTTVSGLTNGTIQTNEDGSFTADKTFTANAGTVYTVTDGKISGADNVETISGDFSSAVKINGTSYKIRGGEVTINVDGTIETEAGTYTVNGKMYDYNTPTIFQTTNGVVTGAQMQGDGTFTIYQDETDFILGDSIISLRHNKAVVLNVEGGVVTEAIGVRGSIAGLSDATVYDISSATVNGTALNLTEADAIVEGGIITGLVDVKSGTVTSAPELTLTTAENGSFTFGDSTYVINDTVDGSVDFITDAETKVTDIENFAGSINGSVGDLTLNGKEFFSNDAKITVSTDGDAIIGVYGLADGSSVGGDLDVAEFILPRGSVTINGASYALNGKDNVTLTGENVITGLEYGATVTVGSAGAYEINGENVTAKAGDAYSTNRDGVFLVNDEHFPLTDETPDESIPADVTRVETDSTLKTGDGDDSILVRNGANATIDVAEGNPTIIAVSGKVTLENYDNNVAVQTFEYTNLTDAIARGDVMFGDGVMTLGDAVITFDTEASDDGTTYGELLNATGDDVQLAFTHTAGGIVDASDSTDDYIMKGNYAANESDTQKSGGSTLTAGSGNDTLLIGAGDVVNAGGGSNEIFITDPALRDEGATIIITEGENTVHNFAKGFAEDADKIQIQDVDALEYGYGPAGLTLQSGGAELTFDNDDIEKIKLTDGRDTFDAQFAPDDSELFVDETADLFFGNSNGINFSEYDGTVEVNLNDGGASLDGNAAQMYGIDKVTAGAGDATLTGANGTDNTLAAGTGNAEIFSGAGNDLLVGYTGDDKTGSATFHYTSGYGADTISNFDFMAGENDTLSDEVYVDTDRNVLTDIHLDGTDVVIGFNGVDGDNLTITDAQGKHMKFNDITAIVDDVLTFDGYTDCYVGGVENSTITVGEGMDLVDIWLGATYGTQYIGNITVLDASNADGVTAMVGNELNNLIIGGKGENSIWGGDGTDDTLVGGSGHNTFFFNLTGGQDIVQSAHDGDIVELYGVELEHIASAEIESDGVSIELTDGSKITVQSAANVEYKLADGSTYIADHNTGDWQRKE